MYPIAFFKRFAIFARFAARQDVSLLFIFFVKSRNVEMLNVFEMSGDFREQTSLEKFKVRNVKLSQSVKFVL